MILTFQHMFKNGDKMNLEVDLSGKSPRLTGSTVEPINFKEYGCWVTQVVEPTIFQHLTPEQIAFCAEEGLKQVKKSLEG